MPTVSVILTSFNHGPYLCEAIDSVLCQSFADFELIILDDLSSDGSWELIQAYKDPRIRSFRSNSPWEIVHLMNRAVSEYATGNYIAMHHSDDAWAPTKLERQVEILNSRSDVGVVFTWAQIIDEHGADVANDWFFLKDADRWQILNQIFRGINKLNHPSALIRRQCYETVGAYRHGLLQTDDVELWSRVLLKFPTHIIEAPLTRHRKFSNHSNVSGMRSDVAIRSSTEWGYVRENFLAIADFDEIVAIFPGLARFRNPEGFDTKFLMAMACLHECKHRSAWYLGITWLFELLNDSLLRQRIKDLYAFSEPDFFELSGSFDVYFVAGEKQLNTRIELLQTDLSAQRATWDATQARYDEAMAERGRRITAYVEALEQRDAALAVNEQTIAALRAQISNLKTDTARLWSQREAMQESVIDRDRSTAALMSRMHEVADRLGKSEDVLRRARSHRGMRLFDSLSRAGILDQ